MVLNLSLGFGLEAWSLGLGLGLEAWSLGLGLGLEAWSLGLGYPSLDYITGSVVYKF